MVKFSKPGTQDPYPVMASTAIREALADAGIGLDKVEQAFAGYCYGATTCGQRALYEVGMTGIPVINVRNACATGSTALLLARQAILAGSADCALAFGFEEMRPGALANDDFRTSPVDRIITRFTELGYPVEEAMAAPGFFGAAGEDYVKRYGADPRLFAEVAVKTRRHAAANPMALFTRPIDVDEVMQAPRIYGQFLTRLMACPPTCGAAAALLVSEDFARRHKLRTDVYIAGQAMTTDRPGTFDSNDMMRVVGYDMSRAAARKVYEQSGLAPEDLDVVELHDCFAHNELITYEALGLCPEGGADKFIRDGDNSYGGKVVTNPSGGLLSKGHPLGATGLAQCFELTHQLRGSAGARQVEGARVALQHNLGLGGACVVTMYRN